MTISTAPRLLLSEILLSLSEGEVRRTDVVPCFSRNWGRGRKGREKKCQSLPHALTSCAVPNTIFPLPLTIKEAQLKMWSVLVESIKQLPRKLLNPTHHTSHPSMSHVHAPAAQTPTGLFIYSQGSQWSQHLGSPWRLFAEVLPSLYDFLKCKRGKKRKKKVADILFRKKVGF